MRTAADAGEADQLSARRVRIPATPPPAGTVGAHRSTPSRLPSNRGGSGTVTGRARSLRFVGPREVRVEEWAVPDPGPGEVLVETAVSLVSAGTELLVYRDRAPDDIPADAALDALDGDLDFPLRYGYAAVGEVVRTGREVDPDWEGRTVFAFNPHESHFTAEPAALVPVPDGVDPETAAFLPNAETAVNLALDGRPRVGERVVVFGAGIVGLLTTLVLGEFPLARLVTVEPVLERRSLATRLGADGAVDPAALGGDESRLPDDAAGMVGTAGEASGNVADGAGPPGADLAYELSGDPDTLDAAVDAVGYDGRVVVGSWYGEKRADVDLGGRFHRDRVELVASQVSTLDPSLRGRWTKERRLDVAAEYLRRFEADDLVTHRFPVAEADRAYDLLDGGPENALGVLFTYEYDE